MRTPKQFFESIPLRVKLAGLLMAAAALPLAMLAASDLRQAREHAVASARLVLEARAEQLKRELDSFHRSHQRQVERVAHQPLVVRFSLLGMPASQAGVILDTFDVLPDVDEDVRGFGLLDLTGRVRVASESALVGQDLSARPYVQRALQGKTTISDLHLAEAAVGRVPTIAYVAVVRDEEGEALAIAAIWVRAAMLWRSLKRSDALAGKGSTAVIYDRLGIRIAHTSADELLFRPAGQLPEYAQDMLVREQRFGENTLDFLSDVRPFPEQFVRARAHEAERGMFRGVSPLSGKPTFGVGRRCETTDWTAFYMVPELSVTEPIDETIRDKVLFALAVCMTAMLLASLVAGPFVEPIRALSRATEALSRGDFTTRVPGSGDSEIGRLAASFNAMAERLDAQASALQASNSELERRVRERTAQLERTAFDLAEEIRERKRVEAALRASEQDVTTTLSSIGDAVIATDELGRVTRMNRVAEQLTGWTAATARGALLRDVFRMVDEDTHEPMASLADCVLGQGTVITLTSRTSLLARDGSSCPIAHSGAPIRDLHGVTRGVVLVFRDVRHEREAAQRLQESEAKYRDLYENSPDMYALVNLADARIEDCNATLARVLQYPKVALVGQPVFKLFHPDGAEQWQHAFRQFAHTGQIDASEFELSTSQGAKLAASLQTTAVRDADGRVRRSRLVWRDISLGKELERDQHMLAELSETRLRYDGVVELLEHAAHQLGQHLGLSRCSITEVDSQNDCSVVLADYYAEGLQSVRGVYARADTNQAPQAELDTGRTVICQDTRSDPRTAAYYESRYLPLGVGSLVAVPLMRASQRVASFWAMHRNAHAWSAREVQLVQTVAERVWSWVEQQRMLLSLRVSEERFRLLVEGVSGYATFLLNSDGTVASWNAGAERLKGYREEEIVGKHFSIFCSEEERTSGAAERRLEQARVHGRFEEEAYRVRRDGSRFLAHVVIHALYHTGGQLRGFAKVTRDLSERERVAAERARLVYELQALTRELEQRVEARTRELQTAHETLARSEARFRTLFDGSPNSLWELDLSAALTQLAERCPDPELRPPASLLHAAMSKIRLLAINQATLQLYEAKRLEDITGSGEQIAPEALHIVEQQFAAYRRGETTLELETVTTTLRGRTKNIGLRLSVVPGHERTWSRVIVSLFDLTAYKEAERQIRASLREKEVLLKEIHHRVKNNLQVISSLLNLQAQHLPEPEARNLFGEAQRRVQSIALVHERLYQSRDLSHIGFDEYVRALIDNLFYTQDAKARGIEARLALDSVRLSIDAAIPCGLIVNELVTNSLKYAFPEGRPGTISIQMAVNDNGRVELQVSDDGIGLPPGFNPHETASLGLELVFAFAQQLAANVEVLRDHGTGFRFDFPNAAA